MTGTAVTVESLDAIIGERVHTLMWRQRVSQRELAACLGVDQSAISKKLHGKRPWSAVDVAVVARRLGVAPGLLYGDQPAPQGPNDMGSISPTNPCLSEGQRRVTEWKVSRNAPRQCVRAA